MKTFRVIVSNQAKHSLNEIIGYIKNDSERAASYVRKTLIKLIKSLNTSPERFSKEPLLSDKPGNYRSVCKWHFKIIYRCSSSEVIVVDIIHTSRNPEIFENIK